MIEAVVFDMDGVLVDSEVIWREVREQFAASIGRVWSEADQASTMGCSTPLWSRIMVERLQLPMTSEEIALEIRGRMIRRYEVALPIRTGALQAVRMAASRYRVALASGSPNELIDWVLDHTGLAGVFEATMYGDDVDHGKPHPEIYQKVLAKLGVDPARAVGIEDSGNGIRSLHAAGMKIIAAPGPEFALPADLLALADRVIVSMEEIDLGLLESLQD